MDKGFEKVRPSWEKVTAKKNKPVRKETPRITYTSTFNENKESVDRIGFSKDALKFIGITQTSKCEIFVHKKTRRIAISIQGNDCATEDSFTISVSKDNASIRRKNMFSLLTLPADLIKMLQDGCFHSNLTKKGTIFIAYLPYKLGIKNKNYDKDDISIASEIILTDKKSARDRTTAMPEETDYAALREVLEDI